MLGAPPGRPPPPLALLGARGAEGCAPPRFALASHFFWGLWSILQAKISTIEFGYLVSAAPGGPGGRREGPSPHAGLPWGSVSHPPPSTGQRGREGSGQPGAGGLRG